MIFLRLILFPISLLYGLFMQIRNILYDTGIFKSRKFSCFVISVGNIITGGTGKTPFTIYLGNLLNAEGKKVAIISRGYRRQSRGYHLVSDGVKNYGNTLLHGDEPVLISLKVPNAIVAVCEDRSLAIDKVLKDYTVDAVILDDAFQHRSVKRDIDIVLHMKNKLLNRLVLPSGMLREFYFNIKRSDIVISGNDENSGDISCAFIINNFVDINFKNTSELKNINEEVVAFAGIAHPENFKSSLLSNGIRMAEFIPFNDHYTYSQSEMLFLIERCKASDVKMLVCTEKDLVKIREIEGINKSLGDANITITAVSLKTVLNDENSLLKKIMSA